MRLTLEGLQEKEQWKKCGVDLPAYDIEKVAEETKKSSGVGTFWSRKYLSYFYRRNRRRTDFFR